MGALRYEIRINSPYHYVSKEEYMSFIDYLRKKEDIVVDQRVLKGLFAKFDVTYMAYDLLEIMKGSSSLLEAYQGVVRYHTSKRVNVNQKYMMAMKEFYFDDLLDYFKENKVEDPFKVTTIIAQGQYKQYYTKAGKKLLSDHFDLWARGCQFLPKRQSIFQIFESEYRLYLEEK